MQMKSTVLPTTRLGQWSAGLNIFYLVVIAAAVISVLVLKILNFDDRWWDVTVPVLFLIEMIALYTGIRAVRKYNERSALVWFSIVMGIATILFVPLHSLFISD